MIDLSTGTRATKDNTYDPATAKPEEIVFVGISSSAPITLGSPSTSPAHQDDETQSPVLSFVPFYIAMTEMTQYQWLLVAGATNRPWDAIAPSAVIGDASVIGSSRPAFGVSYNAALSALDAYNASFPSAKLDLPTSPQWEIAARLGSSDPLSTYSWGEDETVATVSAHAVVRETAGTTAGVRAVASRLMNSAKLYDMHGNVWEWTKTLGPDGLSYILRGGSWQDNLISARSANKQYQAADVGYATAGIRLVLAP